MSLIKLLSVSKSFVSGRNQAGRYRMIQQGLLPKFSAAEKLASLAQTKKPDAPPAPAPGDRLAAQSPDGRAENPAPMLALASPLPQGPAHNRSAPAAPASTVRPPTAGSRAMASTANGIWARVKKAVGWAFRLPVLVFRWTLSLVRRPFIKAPRPAPRVVASASNPFTHSSAIPAGPPQPLQAELSLEAVKPVRNDLSDADLEVVPARPEGASAEAPARVRSRGIGAEPAGMSWSRLTARWFDSERVRT